MKTLTGLFDSHADAEQAVRDLRAAGVPDSDISLISRHPAEAIEHVDTTTSEGVGVGSGLGLVAGGTGGLLAGLGMVAIPGIGPVVAAGWLASTLAGAAAGAVVGGATGGLIGALTGSDISEEDAHVLAESVRRGETLVTAKVVDELVNDAQAILDHPENSSMTDRRARYLGEGWEGFDDRLPPYVHRDGTEPVVEYAEERRRKLAEL